MKVEEYSKIKKYSEVSGVTALVDQRIGITFNKYGLYEENLTHPPNSDINPLVFQVSPNFNKDINETTVSKELYEKIPEINYDKRIGYYLSCYAGYVNEGEYRKDGSSGGMGTWIFKELFERDLIDGVIHVKENKDLNSEIMFKYDISRNIEEIKEGARTKYYPVELSEVLEIVRKNPGRYAVIGIPSFIMSIRLLAKKDPIINERIKYTVGLICGHQKSSKFAESMGWQVGIKPGDLKYINFRKKNLERPANNYEIEMTGLINAEEKTIVKPTKDLLGQNWGHGFFKPITSDFTDDVLNETADITLGDAWLPKYMQDSKGNNIVIVRNPEINQLIIEGIQSDRLVLDEVKQELVFRSQEALYRHINGELPYRLFKKDQLGDWRPKKRVKASKKIPFLRKKVQDLRQEISTKSHIIYEEAVELEDLNYFVNEMAKLTRKYFVVYKFINMRELGLKGTFKKGLDKIRNL